MGKLKLGEDSNSRVAETGEPLYVEDASRSPELTKMAVREEGIQSQLIVPLKSKKGLWARFMLRRAASAKFF